MDSADAAPNNNNYPQKHGISGWMKNNFGKLGNTNFEEYGASPPEHGTTFLADYRKIKNDGDAMKESFLTASAEESPILTPGGVSFSNSFLYDPQLSHGIEQGHTHLPVPALSSLLLGSLTDDTSSSTDTTPFVTPQGSPMIPRRDMIEITPISLAKGLAAQKPRKWLYKGIVADDNDTKVQASIPKKQVKPGNISPTSKKIQCNISNFDINALSPSSW